MKRGDKAHSLVSASTALLLFLIIFSSTEPVFAVQSDLSAEYAYVPNEKSNTISVINTTTDTVISTVPVGNVPVELQSALMEQKYMLLTLVTTIFLGALFP